MREMLARMTSSELTEYMAFDRLEPIGEPRADLRAGILASAFVNHSMSPPRTPARPVDFMPLLAKPEPQTYADPDEHAQKLAGAIFAGASVVKANPKG